MCVLLTLACILSEQRSQEFQDSAEINKTESKWTTTSESRPHNASISSRLHHWWRPIRRHISSSSSCELFWTAWHLLEDCRQLSVYQAQNPQNYPPAVSSSQGHGGDGQRSPATNPEQDLQQSLLCYSKQHYVSTLSLRKWESHMCYFSHCARCWRILHMYCVLLILNPVRGWKILWKYKWVDRLETVTIQALLHHLCTMFIGNILMTCICNLLLRGQTCSGGSS